MSLMRCFVVTWLTTSLLLCACSGGGKEPSATTQPAPEQEAPAAAVGEDAPQEPPAAVEAAEGESAPVPAVPEFQASPALKSTLAAMATEARSAANPLAGRVEMVNRGKAEFMSLCVQCHGSEGRGDGPAAESSGANPGDLTVSDVTAGERFEVIKNGVDGTLMPPFGAAISSRQIWSLVSFMDSLRPAPPAPPEAPPDSAQ